MSVDLAKEFYRSAREETLTRMRIRDNILIVYLGGVSALFAVGINDKSYELLFCIPYLGLGAALLVCQHYTVMGQLAKFCVEELGKFMVTDSNDEVPQWDTSKALKELAGSSIAIRAISHILLLGIPGFMALLFNRQHISGAFPYCPLWWFSAVCVFITVLYLVLTHVRRYVNYNKGTWRWFEKRVHSQSHSKPRNGQPAIH